MLSKGLLPLKRVVLFLAMSLPVQCMSFLWSWSSIRSASSPVHQNKYLCCSHEMVEMMWLEAGLWEQARPSDSAVSAETAHLSCFMGCLGSVIPGGLPAWGITDSFETKIIWSWAKSWADGRSFPVPKPSVEWSVAAHVCCGGARVRLLCSDCLPAVRALRRSSPRGGAVPRAVLCHPAPALLPAGIRVYRAGMAQVHWQELPVLGSLSFCFQCLVLASGSLNSLSLLCCWNRHFHTCLQLDPLSCPDSTRLKDELRNQSVLKLIGRRWSAWFFFLSLITSLFHFGACEHWKG